MSEVKASCTRGMQFVVTDANKHAIVLDSSKELGGEESGFNPSDLLLGSLAGCTGTVVLSLLRRGRQNVTSLEVTVNGDHAKEPPFAFQTMHVNYVFKGRGLDEEAIKRAIELSETKYCPVGASLSGSVKITSSFRIESEE